MKFLERSSRGRRAHPARDDRGATAVEYGLMVALIALIIAAGVTAFGSAVKGLFELAVANPPFN